MVAFDPSDLRCTSNFRWLNVQLNQSSQTARKSTHEPMASGFCPAKFRKGQTIKGYKINTGMANFLLARPLCYQATVKVFFRNIFVIIFKSKKKKKIKYRFQ